MPRKLTTKKFIRRARKVHGDAYEYSETICTGVTNPITFFCNTCKNYTTITQARYHLENNRGCDICSGGSPNIQTKEIFLKRLKYRTSKFDEYDFSKFEYKGNQIKSKIKCDKNHVYSVVPNDLLYGYGCPECAKSKITGRPLNEITTEQRNKLLDRDIFINIKDYTGSNSKLEAECLVCDHRWNVRIGSLLSGIGCPECAKNNISKKLAVPFKEAVKRAKNIYGDEYYYVKKTYVNSKTPMKIVCYEHGGFFASIQSHCRPIRPSVCKECHPPVYGFDKNKEAILYSIRIGDLYKIGITNRNVEQRYTKSDKDLFEDTVEISMSGIDAFEKEKYLKEKYSEYRYNGDDILENGNTEMFTIDIFKEEGF